MREKDRMRILRGLLLTVTTLCTGLLFAGAGDSVIRAHTVQTSGAVQEVQGTLHGLTVAVDAGHGGYDGGAVGRMSGTPEKGLNLDVAQRVEKLLAQHGADTVMTRTGDYALCDEDPPIRKKLQDMQRRAALIETSGADVVLSIHMNEYAGRSESGPQVFYREGCPAGRLLAGAVQRAMHDGLQPDKKREALGGDYYILTLGVPSVLVECGFLSNPEEEKLLLQETYRQQIAEAIVQGLLDWQELEKKPEPLERMDRAGEPQGD